MSLEGFFEPKSIAIIGASRKEGSLGRVFFDALIKFGYTGKIYPINPKAPDIAGVQCYPTVTDLPETPDLTVVMVRKDLAVDAVTACGEKEIKNIIMITAGFKEVGGDGIQREEDLMKVVKKYNMKLIGPNCMGIINADPDFSMNASFSPTEPFVGNVAFVSQSGALGVAVLEMCKALRLGFSIFISEGNKADLTDSDFLEYLEHHKQTKVITLYQESIEEAPRFRKIASRISRKKPIIAIKAGRSESGARAASSHTGALASSDLATDALFKQSGIIRAQSIQELYEFSQAFSSQPLPKGKRVAVITNAGGPAILATDALEKNGLEMAEMTADTQDKMRKFLPEEASVQNPIDMIASANEETYRETLKLTLQDKNVDAVMVIIVRPPVNTTPKMIGESFEVILKKAPKKPVFIVMMAAQHEESCGLDVFQKLKLPVYAYPETAAKSIAAMIHYREWSQTPVGKIQKFDVVKGALQHIFEQAKAEKRDYLKNEDVQTILKTYGFPLAYSSVVQSADEAVDIFMKLNNPLVLKVESDDIVHKSDIGGVKIKLDSEKKIRAAFDEIMENSLKVTSAEKISGMLVQEMVNIGKEIGLGMNQDPNYGPMIMFGMGGIFIEAFKDVAFRIAPVSELDAETMIKSIKGYTILKGIRGDAPVNFNAIQDTILRLSQLSLDCPEIIEMDINPFMVSENIENCKIVDARIRIAQS